jgi:hypothetical protein
MEAGGKWISLAVAAVRKHKGRLPSSTYSESELRERKQSRVPGLSLISPLLSILSSTTFHLVQGNLETNRLSWESLSRINFQLSILES